MSSGTQYGQLVEDNREMFKNPDRMLDEEDAYPLQKCKKCGHIMRNDTSPEGRVHHCPECWCFVRMPTQEESHDMATIYRLRAEERIEAQ